MMLPNVFCAIKINKKIKHSDELVFYRVDTCVRDFNISVQSCVIYNNTIWYVATMNIPSIFVCQ